jgi:ligand-binding sensor domain-containing protein
MGSAAIRLLVLLSLAIPALAHAERLPTKVFTTADGLANNVVKRIVRDSRGYLWFCTSEGLSRFDGYGFTTYGIDDGLPGAVVNDLIETREGTYWIATNGGLVRFDPLGTPATKNGTRPMFSPFVPDSDPGAQDVWTLFQDRAGTLWIGTQLGLYQFNDSATGPVRFAPVDVGASEITSLAEDQSGALWIGTNVGVSRLLADRTLQRYTARDGLPADDVNAILVDRQGRIWVGTRSSGLAVLTVDPVLQRPSVAGAYSARNGLPTNWIDQFFETTNGVIWAATSAGLLEIMPATGAASISSAHPPVRRWVSVIHR